MRRVASVEFIYAVLRSMSALCLPCYPVLHVAAGLRWESGLAIRWEVHGTH